MQNNANEAQPWFTPNNIVTSADSENFFRDVFPLFSDSDFSKLKEVYPSSGDTNPHMTNYSTLGYTGPTALTMSGWANGEQQRVNVCDISWGFFGVAVLILYRTCKLKFCLSVPRTG
jgi:hypothetical protein